MRTLLCALAIIIVGVPPTAVAETPAPESGQTAAIELLELMDLERMMLSTAATMTDAMIQQNPMLGPYRDVLLKWAEGVMTWGTFEPRLLAIYTGAYSEKELRELVDFYRTPTGRKSIELAPELMRQGALIESEIASEHSGLLQQMISARAAELDRLQASE